MLTPQMTDLLQAQFTRERENEQFYRALAADAAVVNRHGAEAYFGKCADDESDHAERVMNYIVDQDEKPVFDVLEAIPDVDGTDYISMFQAALVREQMTTTALRSLWAYAALNDPQTVSLIQNSHGDWPGFLDEQTESERQLDDYIDHISQLDADGIELWDGQLREALK
jgi:ferritin